MYVYIYECICLSVGQPTYLPIYHLCDMNTCLIISRPRLHCHFVQSNGRIDSFITR